MDTVELCEKAGVAPDQEITRFVMEDVAAALLDAEWPEDKIVRALKAASVNGLANALLEASGWIEIFQIACDDELDSRQESKAKR